MIQISIRDAQGALLAQSAHPDEALARVDRVYQPGDVIVIESDAPHLIVQMDAAILPGEVYLPAGRMTWPVPCGEHRLAYSPAAFTGARHIVTARAMTQGETAARRNLARNPADLRGETDFFPHCTANVETRGESCFAARNVIDGMRHNDFHGEWPYQSWGIGAREDAWCLLDLGREVEIDAMALTLRADFPHDSYWTQATVAFDDGSREVLQLSKTAAPQVFAIAPRTVQSLKLFELKKADDASPFPALTQIEVWGTEG